MFSSRTGWRRESNALSAKKAELQARGERVLDLTCSNPTACGFTCDADLCRDLLTGNAVYVPESRGLGVAREAVCRYYAERHAHTKPEQVWLAASTSELYAQLMWLLCDPGDQVLVPRPGYPLFEYLGDLSGVERVTYELNYDGAWHVDLGSMERALQHASAAKAVVMVSPNNPTGNYLKEDELKAVEGWCADAGIALIIDEVFADYPLCEMSRSVRHPLERERCLSFVLSGISKVAALPQMKLSWAVACGPKRMREEALARIDLIADTFLNVASPVQQRLPCILDACGPMQERIRARCRENLCHVRHVADGSPLTVLHAEGGWTALIRLPETAHRDDAGWAMQFLETSGVLVQPAYLFDLPGGAPVVALSLLTETRIFEEGVGRILASVK